MVETSTGKRLKWAARSWALSTPTPMSLWTLGLSLTSIWLAIHTLNELLLSRSRSLSLLPTPTSVASRASSTQVLVKKLHLRIQTTRWNILHDKLAARLASRRSLRLKTILAAFYDVGSVLGLLGMISAIGLLLWTTAQVAFSLQGNLAEYFGSQASSSEALWPIKRTLQMIEPLQKQLSSRPDSFLKPIVSCNRESTIIEDVICIILLYLSQPINCSTVAFPRFRGSQFPWVTFLSSCYRSFLAKSFTKPAMLHQRPCAFRPVFNPPRFLP